MNVNYVRDDDGAPRPTAIEGQADFKTSGAVDVGAMQMSFWYKIDASGEDYIGLLCLRYTAPRARACTLAGMRQSGRHGTALVHRQ